MNRSTFHASGFTLIEAVVATLLLAIVASVIIGLNGGLFNHANDIQKIQQASLLVQACADRVIGIRRSTNQDTFFSNPSTAIGTGCSSLPSPSPSITVSVVSAITTSSPCPNGKTCVKSDIYANTGSSTSTALVTLLFVKY